MPMTRAARMKSTVLVKVTFETGDELNVESRRAGRGYGRVKQLVGISREAVRMTAKAAKLKRDLAKLELPIQPEPLNGDSTPEQKAAALKTFEDERERITIQREPIESEISDLDEKSTENVEALIDWMAGDEANPGAIADWDYFEDEAHTEKVEISRQRLEEFEPAEIAVLASAILENMNVGESKGNG
jgi:hypothetical protein